MINTPSNSATSRAPGNLPGQPGQVSGQGQAPGQPGAVEGQQGKPASAQQSQAAREALNLAALGGARPSAEVRRLYGEGVNQIPPPSIPRPDLGMDPQVLLEAGEAFTADMDLVFSELTTPVMAELAAQTAATRWGAPQTVSNEDGGEGATAAPEDAGDGPSPAGAQTQGPSGSSKSEPSPLDKAYADLGLASLSADDLAKLDGFAEVIGPLLQAVSDGVTGDALLSVFMKLNITDPNMDVEAQKNLQDTLTNLQTTALAESTRLEAAAYKEMEEAMAKAEKMKTIAMIVTAVVIVLTVLLAAVTGGAALALVVAALAVAAFLVTMMAKNEGKVDFNDKEDVAFALEIAGYTAAVASLGGTAVAMAAAMKAAKTAAAQAAAIAARESTKQAANAAARAAAKAAQEGGEEAVKAAIRKAMEKAAEEAAKSATKTAAEAAGKAGAKAATKTSEKVAAKLTTKILDSIVKEVSAEAAKAGSRQVTKEAMQQAITKAMQRATEQAFKTAFKQVALRAVWSKSARIIAAVTTTTEASGQAAKAIQQLEIRQQQLNAKGMQIESERNKLESETAQQQIEDVQVRVQAVTEQKNELVKDMIKMLRLAHSARMKEVRGIR